MTDAEAVARLVRPMDWEIVDAAIRDGQPLPKTNGHVIQVEISLRAAESILSLLSSRGFTRAGEGIGKTPEEAVDWLNKHQCVPVSIDRLATLEQSRDAVIEECAKVADAKRESRERQVQYWSTLPCRDECDVADYERFARNNDFEAKCAERIALHIRALKSLAQGE